MMAEVSYHSLLTGTAVGLVDARIGLKFVRRFPEPFVPNEREAEALKQDIRLAPLPLFEATEEKSFEDWADGLARALRHRTHQVDEALFIRILIPQLPDGVREEAMDLYDSCRQEIEAFLTALAKALYPESMYLAQLPSWEIAKLNYYEMEHAATVLNRRLSRFVRLATRWGSNAYVNAEVFHGYILQQLPPSERRLVANALDYSTVLDELKTLRGSVAAV